MTPPRAHSPVRARRGFTLLEAILALGILAAATIVALEIRATMIRSDAQLRAAQREDRDHQALFEMLVSGMLEDPRIDEKLGYIWQGEFLDKDYRITRTVKAVENPMRGKVTYETAPLVGIAVYTIEYDERSSEFIWYE